MIRRATPYRARCTCPVLVLELLLFVAGAGSRQARAQPDSLALTLPVRHLAIEPETLDRLNRTLWYDDARPFNPVGERVDVLRYDADSGEAEFADGTRRMVRQP